jgi:hypothetical protein
MIPLGFQRVLVNRWKNTALHSVLSEIWPHHPYDSKKVSGPPDFVLWCSDAQSPDHFSLSATVNVSLRGQSARVSDVSMTVLWCTTLPLWPNTILGNHNVQCRPVADQMATACRKKHIDPCYPAVFPQLVQIAEIALNHTDDNDINSDNDAKCSHDD